MSRVSWCQEARISTIKYSNYDYVLLCDIRNRLQRYNEWFPEFITHLQAMFKDLSIPIREGSSTSYLLTKTMLPHWKFSPCNSLCPFVNEWTMLFITSAWPCNFKHLIIPSRVLSETLKNYMKIITNVRIVGLTKISHLKPNKASKCVHYANNYP